jgi:hypothetical protein
MRLARAGPRQPLRGRGRIGRLPAERLVTVAVRLEHPEVSYAGESIGHWEGDTLVVHTTAIGPNAELLAGIRGSGRTQVTERIRLRDRTSLQIDTVVEDPVALSAPWRYSRVYQRIAPRFIENECRDNNRDVNGDEPDLTPPGPQP